MRLARYLICKETVHIFMMISSFCSSLHFGSNSPTLSVIYIKSTCLSGGRGIEMKEIAEESNYTSECVKILICYTCTHVISKQCARYYNEGMKC